MTCGNGPRESLTRPYPYKRYPFQLALGEKVTYEGLYFAIPASGLLLDKRLFTPAASHPVASPVKLYVNKDAAISSTIEPDDDGTVYTSGTPHYADYILDLRSLISDVADLHATDSDHSADQFLIDHLTRARSVYDLSAYQIGAAQYVHPTPLNTVPSGVSPAGASGALQPPGDGDELGAQQIMDIDVDEIQWQPFTRPKAQDTGTPGSIPTEPIFPMALPNGAAPSISTLDASNLSKLALGSVGSGGLLVTGDNLVLGTSIKLTSASGASPDSEGNYLFPIGWKNFPCDGELCQYYSPHNDASGFITADGRQAIYAAPGGVSNGVYMLIASDAIDTSGYSVQHWPGNYHATSGIDINGHSHDGVHVVDKLIYNLSNAPGGMAIGYSPINGKKVFGHWIGEETGSKGETWGGAGPKYQNGDNIYGAGSLVSANAAGNFTTSTLNWASTNNTFSPISWATLTTSQFSPYRGIFGSSDGITWGMIDIQAGSSRGVISRQAYTQWGYIDRIVITDQDRGVGGQRATGTINYHTKQYREGKNPMTGEFIWVLEDSSDSTSNITYWRDTYLVENIFSFFFDRQFSYGLVHANGDVRVQWSARNAGILQKPIGRYLASIENGTNHLVPSTNRTDIAVSIGYFPSWKLVRYVTTNNQISVPFMAKISPANSTSITFHPDVDMDLDLVDTFGPIIWDVDAGVNYLWFTYGPDVDNLKTFFAHVDTDFRIFRVNQTNGDGIFNGRLALLSI